ncbi:hypothetical protein [Aliishimia ponticola]|nr:hypothetical protein [Aliishimia ponticola]
MTLAGLQFLQALAAERKSGCFLEVGPLFGSSTNAIDAGRVDESAPMHTIDTFEPAPWVRERLGIDLSREAFEKYTTGIQNLTIHQGFAPDVVKDTWSDKIGFYFDDATHGDPGWTNNYDFFSPFFTDDAIVCGDDFAGGWPDIVRNVYKITEERGLKLFVIGRVWAFTADDDSRIVNAVNKSFPELEGYEVEVIHEDRVRRNIAASWSWGLHKPIGMTEVRLHAPDGIEIGVAQTRRDGTATGVALGKEPLRLENTEMLSFAMPQGLAVQFCIMNSEGKTFNTKDIRNGGQLKLNPRQTITAIRVLPR